MNGHTTGPWHVRKFPTGTATFVAADIRGRGIAGDEILAEVRNGPVDANARLIAAAPQMYALIREYLADYLHMCDLDDPDSEGGKLCRKTQELLAKIDGGA